LPQQKNNNSCFFVIVSDKKITLEKKTLLVPIPGKADKLLSLASDDILSAVQKEMTRVNDHISNVEYRNPLNVSYGTG
jgi:hypothetical protein